MDAGDEPLPQSGEMPPAPGPSASPDDQAGNPGGAALDEGVLRQMRALLINAGVTASMMDLPGDDARGQGAPREKSAVAVRFGDAEAVDDETPGDGAPTPGDEEAPPAEVPKGRRVSWIRRKMNHMAASRAKSFDDTPEEYNMAEGIYSMFLMSKNWTTPFWYSLFVAAWKLFLYGIVIWWIWRPEGWIDQKKEQGAARPIVIVTQFLLLPVAVMITQELVLTMDVLGKKSWSHKILEKHPQATRAKFWTAQALRMVDGVFWLFIITSLTLYAVDVLNMFLNFAALQFLQDIDDAAYDMAKNGFLSQSLELAAEEISKTKLPGKRASWREYLDSIIFFVIWLLMLIFWVMINWVDKAGIDVADI